MRRVFLSFLIAMAAALFASGCAQYKKQYSQMLDSWNGRHIDQLMAAWGPAEASHQNEDGSVLYKWSFQRLASRPVPVAGMGFWGGGWGRGYRGWGSGWGMGFGWPMGYYGAEVYTRWCETVVSVDAKGFITGWNFNGNACRAWDGGAFMPPEAAPSAPPAESPSVRPVPTPAPAPATRPASPSVRPLPTRK